MHRLPANLLDQFTSAVGYAKGSESTRWARDAIGLVATITAPDSVLARLSEQPISTTRDDGRHPNVAQLGETRPTSAPSTCAIARTVK